MRVAQADTREVSIKTPLGEDKLLFRRMVATEQLGRPYTYEVELLSADENVKVEDLLGENVTIRLVLADDSERYWNGVVTRFAQVGRLGAYAVYHATVRPWFWLLTRTTDCRIYKGTVLDILKKAFEGRDFVDYDDSNLDKGAYVDREFSVQYRETTFDFVSRLLEQEGIYYWFKHADGKSTMMLADGPGCHETAPGCDEIFYYPPSENVVREKETIREWTFSKEIQPGKYVLDDYDFENPQADLLVEAKLAMKHKNAALEVFDYPGEYVDPGKAGKGYVQRRMEELSSQHHRAQGEGDVRGLHVGGLFTLAGHPRDDQNKEYLVVSAIHEVRAPDYEGFGEHQAGPTYSVGFEALDSAETFRSPRITPLPVIRGPQTAEVVGKDGEEIWTDEYGRIKVQFHWDRYGEKDENSSCWIRVAQTWAGKNWGAMHVPRIGQEVIVEFLEGDPDRPIVTGRVYNAEQRVPFPLPDKAMVSGIKSNSTPGGGGHNEISFDDTKGSEKLTIHGQYDMSTTVLHDQTASVGNNRSGSVAVDDTESIGVNQTLSVGSNQTETVGADRTTTIGANDTLTVGANQTVSVGGNQNVTVGSAASLTVGSVYAVNVAAAMNQAIGGALATEVGGAMVVEVGAISSEDVGANKSISAGINFSVDAGSKVNLEAGSDLNADAGANVTIKAGGKLTLKAGGASITLSGGNVTIKGGKIVLKGSNLELKGSGGVKIKGATITEN